MYPIVALFPCAHAISHGIDLPRETIRGPLEWSLEEWSLVTPGGRRHHPARAHGVVVKWFRFGGFDAVGSTVAGQSPGAEHDGEVLAVDHAVAVEVGGAGGRAVVA